MQVSFWRNVTDRDSYFSNNLIDLCSAEPLESKVWDDWTSVPGNSSSLCLDFSLIGGQILVMARMQAASDLINAAANIKSLLITQKTAAARESLAFRTTLHPKPANPLSEVAAAMLMSAKSKFQEDEEFEFGIMQRMHVNISRIQIQLVDSGKTYHVHAEAVAAGLECVLQTMDPAPRRDLHLSLGRFAVMSFAALPQFGTHKIQNDRDQVFLFPELVIRMKSVMQVEARQLDYEFESSFPLQPGQDAENRIDILFDPSKWYFFVKKLVELHGKVERSLEESGLMSSDSDWWEQPLRSTSTLR